MNYVDDPQDESEEEEAGDYINISAEEQMKGRLNTSIL